VKVVPMADKSRFAPAVLIEFKPFSNRLSEPFRRIVFIAPEIDVGKVKIKRSGEHKTVFVGNVRHKPARIVDVYFVGIESAPPVSGRCDASVGLEYFASELVGEGAIVMANDFDPGVLSRKLLNCFPRSIGAGIVEHEYPVAPA
jgi:hypothetical protein